MGTVSLLLIKQRRYKNLSSNLFQQPLSSLLIQKHTAHPPSRTKAIYLPSLYRPTLTLFTIHPLPSPCTSTHTYPRSYHPSSSAFSINYFPLHNCRNTFPTLPYVPACPPDRLTDLVDEKRTRHIRTSPHPFPPTLPRRKKNLRRQFPRTQNFPNFPISHFPFP